MMAGKTDQKQAIEEAIKTPEIAIDVPVERVWLDMQTREIVRECGDTISRYMPGETEFNLYAEMNTFEKRNDSKSVA